MQLSIAAALLAVALLPMALIAAAVRCDSRGPALYRQRRVGLGGRVFTLLKFRTMPVGAEPPGQPTWGVPSDPRATRVGRLLRISGLDELPQLFNVIAGHMNLVGPRPERPELVDWLRRAVPGYDQRHRVRPGITGWAQLHHGPDPTLAGARRKLGYDLAYLAHQGPLFDLGILLRTPRSQWRRSRVQAPPEVPSP